MHHPGAAVAGLCGSRSSHLCSGCYEMATQTFSPAVLLLALPHRVVHVMAPRGLVASPIYYLTTTLLGDHRKRLRVWAWLVFSIFTYINCVFSLPLYLEAVSRVAGAISFKDARYFPAVRVRAFIQACSFVPVEGFSHMPTCVLTLRCSVSVCWRSALTLMSGWTRTAWFSGKGRLNLSNFAYVLCR